MSFKVGDFSLKQYHNFLNPDGEKKLSWLKNYSVGFLNLADCETLVILVNRLAYFIVHGFKVYPNNAYLFKNFKSYKFEEINDKEIYKKLKQIFKRFKHCSELSCEEIARIQEELRGVKKQLNAEKLNGQKREEDKAEVLVQPDQNQLPDQKEQTKEDALKKDDDPDPNPQGKLDEEMPPQQDHGAGDQEEVKPFVQVPVVNNHEEQKNDQTPPQVDKKKEGKTGMMTSIREILLMERKNNLGNESRAWVMKRRLI